METQQREDNLYAIMYKANDAISYRVLVLTTENGQMALRLQWKPESDNEKLQQEMAAMRATVQSAMATKWPDGSQ